MSDYEIYKGSGHAVEVEKWDRKAAEAFASRREEFQVEIENQHGNLRRNYEGFSE